MELIELIKINDDKEAEEWLKDKGLLKRYDRCIRCNDNRIYRVRGKKYKCHRCKYEWSIRKDSILYGLKVPFTKFIMALKLFELEVSVLKASKELQLSYNTTRKIFNIIRIKIYNHSIKDDILKGEVEIDESYFGGKRSIQ